MYKNSTGQTATEAELLEQYRDMLDETLDPFLAGDVSYAPSTVLERVDPIAFRLGFNAWMDDEGWDEVDDPLDPHDDDGNRLTPC